MVVNYQSMSSVDFGVPDFCFLISEAGAGGCGLPLEPVLDVLPARWPSDLCQLDCYDLRDEW